MAKQAKKLTKTALEKFVKKHSFWKTDKKGESLTLTITFHKHVEALVFIARLTVHSEVLGKYPDVLLTEAKVTVTTTTKEAKGITAADTTFIERIDHILLTTYGEHSA